MGLDLSGIEAWTRELLDDVARKRGIRNPEFRRRGELVRLLLRQQYGMRLQAGRERVARGVQAASQVRDLLGRLVGSAFEALPPVAASHGPHEPRPSAAVEQAPASRAGVPAPDAPAATTRTFLEGPARTQSVARALAAAGHVERASQVYAELIARAPDDSALAEEADALRRGELPPAPPSAPSPEVQRRLHRLPDDDRLACDAGPEDAYTLRWRISEAGVRRARAVLGGEGQLTVRLISIQPDAELVVRSAIIEHGPVPQEGDWRSPKLPPGHRCLAAVGLLAGTRFVAIVHAQPTRPAERQRAHATPAS